MTFDLTANTPPELLSTAFSKMRETTAFPYRRDAERLIAIMEGWPTATLDQRETALRETQPFIRQPLTA